MTQPGLRFDRTCPTLRIPMQEDPNKNMAKDNRVAFECPHLEARIRQELISRFGPELKERPIADGDLDRLNEALQADDGNLALNGYGISDLSPLAGLTNLRSLYVNSSRIRDFSPLRELPGFVELALGRAVVYGRVHRLQRRVALVRAQLHLASLQVQLLSGGEHLHGRGAAQPRGREVQRVLLVGRLGGQAVHVGGLHARV